MALHFNIPFKLLNPKFHVLEICDINSTKKFKMDSIKENIPPNTNKTFEKNCNSRDYEHLVKNTPKKHVEKADPVTPNTNFKMLISVATGLDYANCNTPKSRNSSHLTISLDNVEIGDNHMYKMNRKEKSLAIICSRFLQMYPLHPEDNIIVSLDDACIKLGVERRRLYDIVNVFESIDVLRKLAKNQYLWFGEINLLSALYSIKKSAVKENVLLKLQYVLDQEESGTEVKPSCIIDEVQEFIQTFAAATSDSSTLRHLLPSSPLPELRKEKSLAIMSQKFLMLFLVSDLKVISLSTVSKVLNGFQTTEKPAQIKTQIRRLYDIANVLSSIGLIKKEIAFSRIGKRPAYKYIGPSLDEIETLSNISLINTMKPLNNNEKPRSLVRHSSFQEICAVAEMEHKRIYLEETANSAPPFEKSILKSDKTLTKTTFSNLNLKNNCDTKSMKRNNLDIYTTSYSKKSKTCSTASSNILPKMSSENSKKIAPLPVQEQSNLKCVTASKGVIPAKGPYYILNPICNNVTKSPTPIGTILFISQQPLSKSIDTADGNTSSQNKVLVSETINLTKVQQDSIFRVINSSKSAESIIRSRSPRRNLTQLIKEMQEKEDKTLQTESMIGNQLKSLYKGISFNDGDSNGSSEIYFTRNNSSSSSRFDSPLTIPSGYATPVPSTSSNISFLSNSETHSVLKNIEKQPNNEEHSDDIMKKDIPSQDNWKSISQKDMPDIEERKIISIVKLAPWQNIPKLPVLNNNSSNDSINSEVAEILKDKKLGDETAKLKTFLIDEKTILSPIKNRDKIINRTPSPSPFITPPYAPSDCYYL